MSTTGCRHWVRGENQEPSDIRRCGRPADEHPVIGCGRFENHRNYLPPSRPLGDRRREEIVSAITTYTTEHGYAPTFRELTAMVGLSLAGLHYHLRCLVNDGRIAYQRETSRTLRVVGNE